MSDLQMTFHGGVRPACGGPWHLTAGRTVLVRPRQASTLRVVCGRVWATTDAPLDLSARRLGDHVLEIGCGEGRLTWRYASASFSTVGIDPKKDYKDKVAEVRL